MKALRLLVVLLPLTTFASISISWDMPNLTDEVFKVDGGTPLDANSVWQLIWSPDNAISPFNPLNPFEADSSEAILSTLVNPNGSYVLAQSVTDSTDTYVGGYVYTRAFDYVGPTTGVDPATLDGMYYAESGLSGPLQKIDDVPPGTPTTHVPFSGPTTVDQQYSAIPEPTTLLLSLGAYAVLFGLRRRFSR